MLLLSFKALIQENDNLTRFEKILIYSNSLHIHTNGFYQFETVELDNPIPPQEYFADELAVFKNNVRTEMQIINGETHYMYYNVDSDVILSAWLRHRNAVISNGLLLRYTKIINYNWEQPDQPMGIVYMSNGQLYRSPSTQSWRSSLNQVYVYETGHVIVGEHNYVNYINRGH